MISSPTDKSQIIAVVPAAGIGSRMQSTLPKQYLSILGKTILEHTVAKLLAHPAIQRVVIVLHPQDRYFYSLTLAAHPRISTTIGGDSRAESVLAGLTLLAEQDWVLVHDAARPCIQQSDIDQLLCQALHKPQGGILAVPVSDTLKQATAQQTISSTVDRSTLWQALTPQLFNVERLRMCLKHALAKQQIITDEASAMEFGGYQPLLIRGRKDNIKVTLPEDVALATFYLQRQEDIACA